MHDDYGCMCDLSLIQDFAEALNLSTLLLVVCQILPFDCSKCFQHHTTCRKCKINVHICPHGTAALTLLTYKSYAYTILSFLG